MKDSPDGRPGLDRARLPSGSAVHGLHGVRRVSVARGRAGRQDRRRSGASSSGVSRTSAAPRFSSRYLTRFVPGIGTTSSPWASTHARASWLGVQPFARGQLLDLLRPGRGSSAKFSPWNRGRVAAAVVGGQVVDRLESARSGSPGRAGCRRRSRCPARAPSAGSRPPPRGSRANTPSGAPRSGGPSPPGGSSPARPPTARGAAPSRPAPARPSRRRSPRSASSGRRGAGSRGRSTSTPSRFRLASQHSRTYAGIAADAEELAVRAADVAELRREHHPVAPAGDRLADEDLVAPRRRTCRPCRGSCRRRRGSGG